MPSQPPVTHLDPEQVQLVLRRAAELDRGVRPPVEEGMSAGDIERIADEAGLSPDAVRHALAELSAGVTPAPPSRPGLGERLIGPREVLVERLVPGPAPAVRAHTDRFFREQLLQPSRRQGDRVVWECARGLWVLVRRSLDVGGRYAFPVGAVVDAVVVNVPGTDGSQVLVRLAVALPPQREKRLRRAVSGCAAGALVAGLGVAGFTDLAFEAASVATGAGAAGGSLAVARRRYRRDLDRTVAFLEGFLDTLEGERSWWR